MAGIRLCVDLPRGCRDAIIQDRDQVANVVVAALARRGYHYDSRLPARWGFGVIARRVHPRQKLWKVERVIIGSSDADLVPVLSTLTAADLVEPNAVPGSGIRLDRATLYRQDTWMDCESVSLYAISPIRVCDRTARRPADAYLGTGPRLDELLNHAMARRFGRAFQLRLMPDSLYVRSRHGDVSAGMGVKTVNGRTIVKKGLVLPFTLVGPPEDLRDAWYGGLGGATTRGFGCVEMAR